MSEIFKLNAVYNYNLHPKSANDLHTEYEELCKYVYHNGVPLPNGYSVLGKYSYDNGLYAEIVQKGNNIVVVFRGTQDPKDFQDDFRMFVSRIPRQYQSAKEIYQIAKELQKKNPNLKITFTGHSLGGSIAQIFSATTGLDAVTFAAYGTKNLIPKHEKIVEAKIVNYGAGNDPIFIYNLHNQIGDIVLVKYKERNWNNKLNILYPHFLENWKGLDESRIYRNNFIDSNIPKVDQLYYFDKMNKKINGTSTGYASNISECAGTYDVSGYTRQDGTKVAPYRRTCGAKHEGKRPYITNLKDLSKEEMDMWVRFLI